MIGWAEHFWQEGKISWPSYQIRNRSRRMSALTSIYNVDSTFSPYPHISSLFDSKISSEIFTSDLSKIVRIEFKPVFSNWHYMPFHFREALKKMFFFLGIFP